jgi:hypothetical protein
VLLGEHLGVEAERSVLVIDVDTGQVDFHLSSRSGTYRWEFRVFYRLVQERYLGGQDF